MIKTSKQNTYNMILLGQQWTKAYEFALGMVQKCPQCTHVCTQPIVLAKFERLEQPLFCYKNT